MSASLVQCPLGGLGLCSNAKSSGVCLGSTEEGVYTNLSATINDSGHQLFGSKWTENLIGPRMAEVVRMTVQFVIIAYVSVSISAGGDLKGKRAETIKFLVKYELTTMWISLLLNRAAI